MMAVCRVYLTGEIDARMRRAIEETGRTADDIAQSLVEEGLRNAYRDNAPERIVAAAVRGPRMVVNGTTLEQDRVLMTFTLPAPARHHHILHYLARPDFHVEQGFLTSTGRFVSRKEAMGIAVAAGQVSPSKVQSPDLFSEDLW